ALARLGSLRLVHLGGLSSVAVSADGKVGASGAHDHTIPLWDTATGQWLREMINPDGPVAFPHFDPPRRTLFSGSGRYLCSCDVATGKRLWQQQAIKREGFHGGVLAEKIVLAKDRLISLHRGRLQCPMRVEGGFHFHYHPQKVIRFCDSKTG